jgi:hypothetical protein
MSGDATGYHTAPPAHRLGAANVATVEADGRRATWPGTR